MNQRTLWMVLAFILASAALAVDKNSPAALTDWFKQDHIVVDTSNPEMPGHSRTEFYVTPSGDRRIEVDSTDGRGTILLIGGNWLLTRDLTLESGYEDNVIEGPSLGAQLPLQLLAHVFPHGPGSVPASQTLDVKEPKEELHISSSHANVTFAVPWTLTGVVERLRPELVRYDLTFSFSGDGESHSFHVVGSVENLSPPLELPDDFSLAGWKVHYLGDARPMSEEPRTLGDLRKKTQAKRPN